MLTGLLFTTILALLFTLALITLAKIIQVHLAYKRFKKDSDGLPLLPEVWRPGGHMHQISFDPYILLNNELLHRKYGKTFGWMYGSKPVCFSVDLDLIKTVCVDETRTNVNRIQLFMPVYELEYNCIAFAENDQWRRIRRALSPAFTKQRVNTQNVTSEIDTVIDKLVGFFEERLKRAQAAEPGGKGPIMNADDATMRYSTDLIFSCFYKQYNLVDYSSETDSFSHTLETTLSSLLIAPVQICCVFPRFRPVIEWLLNFHPMGTGRRHVKDFINQQTRLNLRARNEMAKADKDGIKYDAENMILSDGTVFKRNMIDTFIDNYHDGKLTTEEYLNSSFFLFFAGIKTAADALSRLLFYLAAHSSIQTKLRDSIIEDGIESEYLNWCINESLRIEPPAPIGCSRRTERDIKLKEGGTVPKGTFIMTPAYTIHRMPEYWGEDAHVFRPERWQKADTFHPLQFMAFGAGTRRCPGKEFAMHEMRKVVCALLKRYKFERCEKTSDSQVFQSPFFIYMVYNLPTYIRVSRVVDT